MKLTVGQVVFVNTILYEFANPQTHQTQNVQYWAPAIVREAEDPQDGEYDLEFDPSDSSWENERLSVSWDTQIGKWADAYGDPIDLKY